MRRALAITLLLAFVSIASGASTAWCARDCATPEHRHPAPVAKATLHHHHHHQIAPAPEQTASLVGTPHCVRSAPPALVRRSLPQSPTLGIISVMADALALAPSLAPETLARFTAAPLRPRALPSPLRI